ncbi:MAG TPA: biotin transporter BioY [Syntrophomonadaceae bacterium]|nr:biotin transporter BioY [Syntrophomonadaceae bacterium]
MVLSKDQSMVRQMVYASMFGALTAIGAFIVIPLQPVPITLQTLFTGLAGILLGGYAGVLSQIIYVILGVIGLPVFAGGQAGFGTLLGPAGGYLFGFIAAAYVIGKMVESKREAGLAWIVLSLIIGDLVIYTLGTLQLSLLAHLSIVKALLVGVVPFLVGDLIKMAAAVLISLKFLKSAE